METKAHERYRLRQELDGTWTIFDVFTGLPAVIAALELTDLDIRDADETLDLLNRHDLERRRSLGI